MKTTTNSCLLLNYLECGLARHGYIKNLVLPITFMQLGLMMPLGNKWKSYILSPTTTVCPALLPPFKQYNTDNKSHHIGSAFSLLLWHNIITGVNMWFWSMHQEPCQILENTATSDTFCRAIPIFKWLSYSYWTQFIFYFISDCSVANKSCNEIRPLYHHFLGSNSQLCGLQEWLALLCSVITKSAWLQRWFNPPKIFQHKALSTTYLI